jgi:hypothetical protein
VRELTSDEVLALVDFVSGCDPVIVGGQSVNLWAINLRDIEFVVRDNFIGTSASRLEHTSNPAEILRHFVDDARLDARWRERILLTSIQRLQRKQEISVRRRSSADMRGNLAGEPGQADPSRHRD